MKKIIKKKFYGIIILICIFGLYNLYYYYPRNVSFELAVEIDKPHKDYDNSPFIGFHTVENKSRLMFWMVEKCESDFPGKAYDSIFVESVSQKLNYKKFNYIIVYQKELKELRYSPYLTKTRDGLPFNKTTPLIPTFDTSITDKIYIYQLKKTFRKFRSLGP